MAPDPELGVKLLSFTACLSNVAWGRYQGVYLNQSQGLTSNGALRAMGLAAKFLATPLWGARADYMGDPVLPLLLSVVLITLLFDFYRWPSVVGAFGPLLVLKVVRSACNGVNTLVDIVTLRTIEFKEAAGYGSQRLWTAIAWGLGSMFVGRFIDRFGYIAIFIDVLVLHSWWSSSSSAPPACAKAPRPRRRPPDEWQNRWRWGRQAPVPHAATAARGHGRGAVPAFCW